MADVGLPAIRRAARVARAGAELGHRCTRCGALHFPARTICRICRGRDFVGQPLTGRGVVHAIVPSDVPVATAPPRVRVLVLLEEGLLVGAHMRPAEAIPGLPVVMLSPQERAQEQGALFRAARPSVSTRALGNRGERFGPPWRPCPSSC